jgi:uncharacterized repeat protein (TIGR01451 family)
MDTLPMGVTFVSATGTGWTCNQMGGVVTCTRASLAVGMAPDITIVVTPTATGTLTNNVTVMAAEPDPVAGNNSASAMTTVNASANLAITKTDSPDPVLINTNLTYTITVTNAGPSPASMLTMTDMLPANTTFQSLTSPAGWACTTPAVGAGGTVTCTIATLASGAPAATFTLVIRPTVAGNLSNTATIASATPDPNNANNSATAPTVVSSQAVATDFTITAAPAFLNIPAGQSGMFTVTVAGVSGGAFNSAIGLSCSSPTGTCTVSPNSLTPGGNPAMATMTVSTQEILSAAVPSRGSIFPLEPFFVGGMWLLGLALMAAGWAGRRARVPRLAWCSTLGLVTLLASLTFTQAACSRSQRIAGPYTVTVVGTSGNLTHSTTVQVNVIVP